MLTTLSHDSAYYNPLRLASELIRDEVPLPVDLLMELDMRGINLDEFKLRVLAENGIDQPNIGMSLAD